MKKLWPTARRGPLALAPASQSRRAQRQGQQWTSLAHADPPCISSESLQEKVAALKKALTSAERQLEEALKKGSRGH